MRLFLLTILLFGNLYSSFSQEIIGSIKNDKGEVLPFASIYLLKSKLGTTSSQKGLFQLKLSKELSYPILDTLVVSYVGYNKYKKAVYLKRANQTINITLGSSLNQLKEFEVRASASYSPEKIIKLAIKKTKRNYSKDQTSSNGFYREMVKENEKCIMLNEAAIQLKYAPYPQKGFLHQAFKGYYDYSSLPWNISPYSVFRHVIYFPNYIPIKKDQIKIVSSRISLNETKYGAQTSPVGGPGDLVALDKIKYRYDFFDPKLIEKYTYKLIGETNYENENCYIIEFYPKDEIMIPHGFHKKTKSPIYTGRIYIATESFSVVNFQYQFAKKADFSRFKYVGISNNLMVPAFIRVTVNYKKYESRWMLNSVKTEQQKSEKRGGKMISYSCLRFIKLEPPIIKRVKFNRDSTAFITKSTQLRSFYNKYDEQFWKEYEQTSSYTKLDETIKKDLEQISPLKNQFLSLNLPVDSLKVPIAKKVNYKHVYPIENREDNYNWLSKKGSDDVLNYLKAEKTYYNDVTFKLNDSIKGFYYLYNNIFKTKIDTVKRNTSFNINGVKCKYKQDEKGNTGLYKVLNDSAAHLLLDITKTSKGKTNFWIESLQLNKKEQLAYAYSQKGDIVNTLIINKPLSEDAQDTIFNISHFLWLNDTSILYTKTSATGRWYQLRVFNPSTSIDSLIYEEKDKTFDISIKKSTSHEYIFIVIENMDEREYYYVSNNENKVKLNPIVKRLQNHNYTVDHKSGDLLYAVTNKMKDKYELVQFPINNPTLNNWETLYTTTNPIEDFYITKDFIAIQEYNKTTLEFKCINKATKKISDIKFDDEIFSFYFNKRRSDTSNTIQIDYESPKTAYITYSLDLENNSKKIAEQETFKYDKNTYKVKLIEAKNSNIRIPITLFYDETLVSDSVRGIILKSYGAYGAKYYPDFSSEDKVYVDRGFIIAYAHVRGGGELGEEWYKAGKLLNKVNTFEDYVSCAKFLTKEYKIKPKQLVGYGLSAGGLIMGYVANNYPELFGTLIFDRPYLDVINTMMDSSLALTTMEYDEWGNPNDTVYYNYIKSYSPYQNIKQQDYPNMLFLSSYNDEQTPYWQIAKSVAKYRANNTSKSLILLNTNLTAGHRGSTNNNESTSKLSDKYSLILYTLINK